MIYKILVYKSLIFKIILILKKYNIYHKKHKRYIYTYKIGCINTAF
jgi:hypothetical protein